MELESFEPSKTILEAPWDKNENVIWLASTLRIHRNIDKFKFPSKLEDERKKHLRELVANELMDLKEIPQSYSIKAEDLSPLEKDFFLEHFLIFDGFHEGRQGNAFVLDPTGQFIALLNVKDHLQLQLTDCSGDLEKTWSKLIAIENGVSSKFKFSFSQKFGFLTSDPALCGTGLVVSAFLHLPALIHLGKIQDFSEQIKNDGVVSFGLQGDPEELVGDMLVIRNSHTLGLNEESILGLVRSTILKLLVAEKSARTSIAKEHNTSVIDAISRSLGILKFSYQLETVEALYAISHVKLGIELGWIQGMSVQEVNKLFFGCRRAHLNYNLHEKIPHEQIAAKRADFLRSQFAHLNFDFHEKKQKDVT